MAFFGPWPNELCGHLQNPLLKTLKTIHDKKFVDQPWLFGSWSNKFVATLTYLNFILGPLILGGHQNKSIESWNIIHTASNVNFSSMYISLVLWTSTFYKLNLNPKMVFPLMIDFLFYGHVLSSSSVKKT